MQIGINEDKYSIYYFFHSQLPDQKQSKRITDWLLKIETKDKKLETRKRCHSGMFNSG